MRLFNKLYGISLFTLLLSVASCTSETEEQRQTPAPDPSGSEARREVMLTLKNKLSVVKTKAGDAIATAEENKISSLDIYVFGSTTENGTYTYQERFSYRESSSDLPAGFDVTPLELTAVGSDGKQTNALLSLKKGLFVKLYCIANQSKLIDPATNAAINGFIPLVQSNPGQPGNTVTEGTPAESDFLLFKSIQLDPASATDILKTPLPMTGAYATPLDLTDFSVSARLQLGFRLTRSVARFDIVNDAATSKFTIQSVSMANGRKGVSFFPLKVTGTLPTAAAGDLITYPARPFDGEKANTGNCLGAFYTWPSPMGDGGYLVLSGTYAANQTENVPVTYKVPFKPEGDGNYIEVSQNHRYTVNITKADEYHLDFTINVEDWTDEGNIDDYEPGGNVDADGLVFANTGVGDITYDADTRTVTIGITGTEQFTLTGASTSGYFVTMYYENGDKDNQWLEVIPKPDLQTKADDNSKIEYTIKLVEHYVGKYPVATLRFTDKITAKESIVIVQPLAKPVIKQVSASSGSSINVENKKITFHQNTDAVTPEVMFDVFASGGSKLLFGDSDAESPDNWLTVTQSQTNYTLKVNTLDPSFTKEILTNGIKIKILNIGNEALKEEFALTIKSDFAVIPKNPSSGSTIDATNKIITFYKTSGVTIPSVTFNVFAFGGSKLEFPNNDVTGNWLTIEPIGKELNKVQGDYKLTVNPSGTNFPDPFPTAGIQMKITNKGNDAQTETYTLKMKSDVTVSTVTAGQAELSGTNIRLYNDANAKVTLTVNSIGGTELVNKPGWLTIAEDGNKNVGTYTFTVANGASGTTGTNNTIILKNKLDNNIVSTTYTVYSIKKELVFSNYTDNSSYSYIDNLSNTNPAITYFPCTNSYCEFTVVSPKGVNISTSTSSPWASVTEYSSDKNSATGVVTSKVRVQRTYSGDYYGDLRQSTFTATVSNKYPSQTSKSFSIAQKEVVYPNSSIPAKSITSADNSIQWWVAPINENNGNTMYYTTFESNKNNVCPSGWKVPSSANYRTLVGATSGNAISNDHISQYVLNSLYDIYGKTNGYYSSDSQYGEYRCGMLPFYYYSIGSYYCVHIDGLGDSNFYIRCVKDR